MLVNSLHLPFEGIVCAIKYDDFGDGLVPDLKVLTKHQSHHRSGRVVAVDAAGDNLAYIRFSS